MTAHDFPSTTRFMPTRPRLAEQGGSFREWLRRTVRTVLLHESAANAPRQDGGVGYDITMTRYL